MFAKDADGFASADPTYYSLSDAIVPGTFTAYEQWAMIVIRNFPEHQREYLAALQTIVDRLQELYQAQKTETAYQHAALAFQRGAAILQSLGCQQEAAEYERALEKMQPPTKERGGLFGSLFGKKK